MDSRPYAGARKVHALEESPEAGVGAEGVGAEGVGAEGVELKQAAGTRKPSVAFFSGPLQPLNRLTVLV